jgi:gliding motility-associated-like protein
LKHIPLPLSTFFFLILVFHSNFLHAQLPPVYWQKSFGGSGADLRSLVRATSDHGCILGGFSLSSNGDILANAGAQDIAILKLDACGNRQWTKQVGGSGLDLVYGLTEITGNGYYFAGSTSSSASFAPYHGGSMDAIVGRLDASGNTIWTKTFGGSADELLFSILVLPDTSCVIAGWTNSTDGDGGVLSAAVQNGWLIKIDKNGNLIWKKVYGGSFSATFFDLSFSNDGGFIMTGNVIVPPGNTNTDFYIVKTDANGNLIWQKQYGGASAEGARTVRACSDGGYIAAGNARSSGGDVSGLHGATDAWIIRIDESGNLLWQKCIGGAQAEDVWEMMALPGDRYLFAAGTSSTDGDITHNKGAQDAMLIEMDGSGNIVSLNTYGGTGFESFFGISSASDGSIILSGNSNSNDGDISGNRGSSDFILFKLKDRDTVDKDTSACHPFVLNNIPVSVDTSFSAVMKDQCGYDSALVTWHVTITPSGFVHSIPDTTINAGEQVRLTTMASGPVEWTGPALSCTNCTDPLVQPIVDSRYIVSTAQGDCKISDTIYVHVMQKDSLYIPTAFTPNGDGLNDYFRAIGTASDYSMMVYNRWGQLVFQTRSITEGWNGRMGEKPQASGVYVFLVRYRNSRGQFLLRKGTVLLIR